MISCIHLYFFKHSPFPQIINNEGRGGRWGDLLLSTRPLFENLPWSGVRVFDEMSQCYWLWNFQKFFAIHCFFFSTKAFPVISCSSSSCVTVDAVVVDVYLFIYLFRTQDESSKQRKKLIPHGASPVRISLVIFQGSFIK